MEMVTKLHLKDKNMIRLTYTTLLLLLFLGVQAQKNTPEIQNWLSQNIVDLKSDYFKQLDARLEGNEVLGLAESSHGTEEFFREKNSMIKHLITNRNYEQIGLEFPAQWVEKVNQYVLSGTGNLNEIMADFRLYKTQSFYDLFEWIKAYNAKTKGKKIEVFGFDDLTNSNYLTRDSLMAQSLIDRQTKAKGKFIVWGHNVHLSKDTTQGYKPFGHFLAKRYGQKFFNIAFDTYQGTVTVISVDEYNAATFTKHSLDVPKDNFTALFATQKFDNFFVYLSKNSPFSGLKNTISHINSDLRKPYEIPVNLAYDFDALIFIKNTTPSVMLK